MKICFFGENLSDIKRKEYLKCIKDNNDRYDELLPDVVFVFGGDGTFLKAVNHYLDIINKVNFVPLRKDNSLGFFYEFKESDFAFVYKLLKANRLNKHSFPLLKGSFDDKSNIFAVNEIRIECPFSTFKSKVFIDNTLLEMYRGNGLNISSSLGSSAYNKSLGGALIDSSLSLLQLSEIAPINNSLFRCINSPLVISKESNIKIELLEPSKVIVGYDQNIIENKIFKSIVISLEENKSINILFSNKYSYIKNIRRGFIKNE